MMKRGRLALVCLLGTLSFGSPALADTDVCVYGATSAGVVAAVQAARMGKSVILVAPGQHPGGLSSGGLGFSDTGNHKVIGGLAREFYHRVWQHYDQPAAWKWQARSAYSNQGQGTRARDDEAHTMWVFEPHVAEQIFESWLRENRVTVHRNEWLDRTRGVLKEGARITSLTTLSGKTFRAKIFIDATYEGDLMAAAGVDYRIGREAQSFYGEQWNGVQIGVMQHSHNFGKVPQKISPYVVPGDPASGVLPRISTAPPGDYGQGDKRIQAYCYRLCLTDNPDNLVPFSRPERYDPRQYELLLRVLQAGWRETFVKFDRIPNRKTDVNNHGPVSTDNIGYNYDYPEASYERRREILQEHQEYQKGWLYFLANDSRVPGEVQTRMRQWGLAQDEFVDNGNWPHQIYVREARRMVGTFVMTEHELTRKRITPAPIGMGSYAIDSHNVQRYITPEGYVENEGDIGVPLADPYQIAYGALVPKRGQCDNLIVPVCVSSSHIAFGSIRMEPVFMVLGQSAATAAGIALEAGVAVQAVPYAKLRERLLKDGQVLEYSPLAAKAGSAPRAAASQAPNPLAPIRDEPGLPRVLLIGDSISMGYTLPVRQMLQGQANVHRIPANGATSANGLKCLSSWLGTGKWDVIHFNFGIHDAKFMSPGKQQVSHAEYESNLRELVKRLQETHAKLIWCTTTPIPPGELVPPRRFDDVSIYNGLAAKVMAEEGIAINDLNTYIRPHTAQHQVPHDVHFTPAGSELLARQVAAVIQAQLPRTAKPSEEGFVSLFDGQTLKGWRDVGPAGGYGIKDGAIFCSPKGENLFTARSFTNFILRFEFKLQDGSNNGIGIRAPFFGNAAYVGMEIQVLDDAAADSGRWGKLRPEQFHGSIYDVVAARRHALSPVGQWNTEEITADDRHIKVVVNGITVVDANLNDITDPEVIHKHPGLFREEGHIGFLGHGRYIEFRNLRLKELPQTRKDNAPPPAFTSLLDGDTLRGWKGSPQKPDGSPAQRANPTAGEVAATQAQADDTVRAHWTVQNGELVFDGQGPGLSTTDEYQDFELLLDWNIPARGEGGVDLRGTPRVQIRDPFTEPALGTNRFGSGGLCYNQKGFARASKLADKPVGQWNQFRIVMAGEKVHVFVNGEMVVNNAVLENSWDRGRPVFPVGPITLASQGYPLRFKNIYLRQIHPLRPHE